MLVVLCVYVVALLYLFFWAFITSFKDPMSEYLDNRIGLPKKWYFLNYPYIIINAPDLMEKAQGMVPVYQIILNSVMYAVGCAVASTTIACLTSYACAKYKYKILRVMYYTVIIVMVIPVIGSQASEVQFAINLGLYDHIWGLWIMKANFLGIYFLVFYEIFRGLPMSYNEAAKIDGASDFRIMTEICIPLVKNTFLTVILINFITFWNDYQVPILFAPNRPTLAEFLFQIRNASKWQFGEMPVMMAATFLLLIPVLVLFLAFQKRLMGNLTIGGIKG